MGEAGEGMNFTHQQKKIGEDALKKFRDRYRIPISDDELEQVPFYKPAETSPEMHYMRERREALGGSLPVRRSAAPALRVPPLDAFAAHLKGTGDRDISTTMALVRMIALLTRDPELGPRIVPIVADEARTFGMDGLFRQLGIYASEGQLYEPVDSDQVMYYREDRKGQILQEGSRKRAPRRPGSPPRRRTATTASRSCPSTSTTRCSASSAWATSSGPPATAARGAS